MKKVKYALVLSLLFVFAFAVTVHADIEVVSYDDTDSDYTEPSAPGDSLIRNGDFNDWTGGGVTNCEAGEVAMPTDWCSWADSKTGWNTAHLSEVDLSFPAGSVGGLSEGMGWFIQHSGGSGGFYAGAYQHLTQISQAGYYYINVSETIWYLDRTGSFNSIAWYAISSEKDPAMVTDWRELDPYTIQCPNGDGICNYAGRDETLWINPGDYFHLKVGQKFPVFFASSVFILDDISIVAADGTVGTYNGFYNWVNSTPVDIKWHYSHESCSGCIITTIAWDPGAPR